MRDTPGPNRSDHLRGLIVRLFIKTVAGLALVFVIAAIAAPRLFDTHDDLMTIAAFVLWIACPLLLFFVGWELLVEIRKINERHPPR
ncbi:MAG TPA: hypothetical protein VGL66_08535 [Caulobacteraceae bacterium]|jgi:hypothetical protein